MFEKFSKFVGVQGVIALALTGAVIALALSGRPVPEILANLASAAAGFYFGSKGGNLAIATVRRVAIWAGWDFWYVPVSVSDKPLLAVNPGGKHYAKTVRIGRLFFQIRKVGKK